MPRLGPISRRDLIYYLRRLGFDGPFPGGNHEFMTRGTLRVIIPNPHRGDIGRGLLVQLLHEGGISSDEWESL